MLGALAWQATVIKKYSCVRGRRSHGACFFGPGFSSPMVSLCLLLPVLPSSLELASTIAAAKTWSYSETHKSFRGFPNSCTMDSIDRVEKSEQGAILGGCDDGTDDAFTQAEDFGK
uniref:Uncharacterized protein n=1 Tax=Setaria italica TaxID=4555 RepID=K3XNB7_SETIT